MISDAISQLSPKRVASLFQLPFELLNISVDSNNELSLLVNFSEYLTGERNWNSIIRMKLDANQFWEAISYAGIAIENGFTISNEINQMLTNSWNTLALESNTNAKIILEKLSSLANQTVIGIDLIEKVQQQLVSIKLPEFLTYDSCELHKLSETFMNRNKLFLEAKETLDFINELKTEDQLELLSFARHAFYRLLKVFEEGSMPIFSHEANLFRLLPEMLIQRCTEILKQIADPEVELHKISYSDLNLTLLNPENAKYNSPRITRVTIDTNAKCYESCEELFLSTFSKAVISQAPTSQISVISLDAIEEIKQQSFTGSNIPELGNLLIGVAKTCNNAQLKNVAIGEGLLLHGRYQMQGLRYDHARKLLVDSLTCLAESRVEWLSSIEQVVFCLLTAWIWPQTSFGTSGISETITEWCDDPKYLIRHLRNRKYLDVVGKIWANEISSDFVAAKFFEIISASLGDDRMLFRHGAERILTPYNLIKYTDRFFNRLNWLLKDATPTYRIEQLFDKLAAEITIGPDGLIPVRNTRIINETLQYLVEELNNLSEVSVAPINEIKSKLPEILKGICSKGIKNMSQEPEVTIRKLVNILYPDERSIDLEFPLLVSNASNGAPASDVTLTLRYDGSDPHFAPDIRPNVLNIGELSSDQEKEAIFVLDLPNGLLKTLTEWKFKVEINIDGKVKLQKFSIKILPSRREYRSSPFVAGTAVSGEHFIGREAEMQRVLSSLCGDKPNVALAVFGIRRIGKTSVLKQILRDPNVLKRYFVIFWDVEDWSRSGADFMLDLCDRIRNIIPDQYWESIPFNRQDFKTNPFSSFEKFIGAIDNLKLSRRILVMLDEFDKLLRLASQHPSQFDKVNNNAMPIDVFNKEVFAALRKAIMMNSCFSLIIAGMPSIMKQEYEERFFGLLEPILIPPFKKREAELVIRAGDDIMKISTECREQIFEASGLQPYILQLICNELFHRMIHSGRDIVAPFDLKSVIEEKILPNENCFLDYDSLIKDERIALYGLALAHKRAQNSNRDYVDVKEIAQELARIGREISFEDIRKMLLSLKEDYATGEYERPLVQQATNNPNRFKLVIGLLGDHLIRKGIN